MRIGHFACIMILQTDPWLCSNEHTEVIMKLMHVTIQTDKFEKEIEFYEKFAGLKVMQDMRPMGKNIVFLAEDKTDTCIEIIENKDAENAGNINLSIGFHAEDTDAKRNELATAGFEPTPVISPMPGVSFFFVKDPAGVTVQFI